MAEVKEEGKAPVKTAVVRIWTFTKMENLAKNNIASVIGLTPIFLEETVKANSKADPFVHDKNS